MTEMRRHAKESSPSLPSLILGPHLRRAPRPRGDNTFAVYERTRDNDCDGDGDGRQAGRQAGRQQSDRLHVGNVPVGRTFPKGMLITHDGESIPIDSDRAGRGFLLGHRRHPEHPRRLRTCASRGAGISPEVLYLVPEPDTQLRQLTQAIADRWPETPPYGCQFAEPASACPAMWFRSRRGPPAGGGSILREGTSEGFQAAIPRCSCCEVRGTRAWGDRRRARGVRPPRGLLSVRLPDVAVRVLTGGSELGQVIPEEVDATRISTTHFIYSPLRNDQTESFGQRFMVARPTQLD